MRINNNLMAMNTHRQLSINGANTQKSIEKLSSGYRINRAGDDAAGLAISEKMRGQIRGLDQASRNAQDSISLIQTAEGALAETHSILQRMRELAVQSANDTNVDSDRSEIQNEINQLTSEINRIANTTEFNTNKLLNGGASKTGKFSYTEGVDSTAAGAVSAMVDSVASVSAGTAEVDSISEDTASVSQGTVTANAMSVDTASSTVTATTGDIGSPLTEVDASIAGVTVAITGDDGYIYNQGQDALADFTGGGLVTLDNDGTAGHLTFTVDFGAADSYIKDGDTFTLGGTAYVAGTDFEVGLNNSETVDNFAELLNDAAGIVGASGTNVTVTGNSDGSMTFEVLANAEDMTFNAVTVDAAGTGLADVTGGITADAQTAVYTLEFTEGFTAGDKITVGGVVYTAGDGLGGTFDATGDLEDQVTKLAAAITAGDLNGATAAASASDWTGDINSITITAAGAGADANEAAYVADVSVDQTNSQVGRYKFEIASNFEVGEQITIGGEVFTAVANGDYVANTNVFEVGTDINDTATKLVTAINGDDELKATWDATVLSATTGLAVDADTILLTEKVASGSAQATLLPGGVDDIDKTATKGQYSIELTENMVSGDSITVGANTYTAGTAAEVLAGTADFAFGGTIADTVTAIAGAITADGTAVHAAVANGNVLELEEDAATGVDLAAGTLKVTQRVAVEGEYSFEIATNFVAGDSINIAGTDYVAGTAAEVLAGSADFEVGADAATTADNLATVLDATAEWVAVDDGAVKITLTEATASGNAFDTTPATGDVVVTQRSEVLGENTFQVTTNFEDGDEVTVGGNAYTAGVDFEVGADIATSATNLAKALDDEGTYDVASVGDTITITEKTPASGSFSLADAVVARDGDAATFTFTMRELTDGGIVTIDGEDLEFATGGTVQESATELKTLIEANATLDANYTVSVSDVSVTLTQKTAASGEPDPTLGYTTAEGSGFNATLQIGANTGQTMNVDMNDMGADALGVSSDDAAATTVEVDGKQYQVVWTTSKTVNSGTEDIETEYSLDISTADNATAAVEVINNAINAVSSERSKLGAFQNRLEHTIRNLDASSENLQASESRIRDVDMAKEMMEFTKNNILQQAAQSMLAQANQQPQGVLQLLR